MGRPQRYTDEYLFEVLGWDDFKRRDIEDKTGCCYHTSVTFLERNIANGRILRIKSRLYRANLPITNYDDLRNVDCRFVGTTTF